MIETKNLTKTFDNFTAVDSLDLKIETGEFFGLLGPNGAGKTTTISLLSTLLLPTKGEILIDGQKLTRNRPDLKRKISVITQEYSMRQDMNMDEIMEYQGRLYFMPRKEIKRRTEELLEFCDLIKFRKRTVRKLSGGMKQRVGIARALANDPDILLMDEAFSALDPLVRNDLQFELLRIQEKTGKTIVFITHDINEAFRLGTHVGILRDGRMVQIGTPEEMITNPADDYVRSFINNADSSKIFTVRNVMSTQTCIVRNIDGAAVALRNMKNSGVSSAYVVDEHLRFIGIITLDSAMQVLSGYTTFDKSILRNVPVIDNLDTPVADIMPLSASTPFPLPVIDENKLFCGIVTKASVISSFVTN